MLVILIPSFNFSYGTAAKPRPSAEKNTIKKSFLPPNLPIQNSDCYKSYDEFCKCVASIKLPQKWEISIGNKVHCWKKGNIHEIPEIEVFIDNLLNFTIKSFCLISGNLS